MVVTCNISNHEFKNPWINAFCRNHENWGQQIKRLSQYFFILKVFLLSRYFYNLLDTVFKLNLKL